MELDALWLAVAFFLIALIYAAVGQAGASGYIAIMALLGFAPLAMKTTALALNLLVAAIGTAMFLKAGRLSWRSVWPFAVLGLLRRSTRDLRAADRRFFTLLPTANPRHQGGRP